LVSKFGLLKEGYYIHIMKRDNILFLAVLTIVVSALAILQVAATKHSYKFEKQTVNYVDSVWFTKPGQEHSLQTSYKYYGRLDNGRVVSHNKPFHIGDSIVSIHYGK